MKTKICSSCKLEKSLTDFHKDSTNKTGHTYYCKVCANTRSRVWHSIRENLDRRNQKINLRVQERKRKFVKQLGDQCFDCKQSFPDVCYDFHHLDDSTKEFNPANGLKLSEIRMQAELSKCVLLCSNCHRLRHYDSLT